MSWHVTVYPLAVYKQYESLETQAEQDRLFEEYDKLPKFSAKEMKVIREHLARRGYVLESGDNRYINEKEAGATVLLTDHAVYFTGKGGDGTMEISMTSGEFTYHFAIPKETFAVWDMQDQKWQS